jgi:hypothetical protein
MELIWFRILRVLPGFRKVSPLVSGSFGEEKREPGQEKRRARKGSREPRIAAYRVRTARVFYFTRRAR